MTVVLFIDQVSKFLVAARLQEGQSWDISPWLTPIFRLTYVKNTGAVFGLFPGASNFFVIVSVIVIGALLIYYRQLPDGQLLVRIALGLQLGGAVGNLVDRLRHGFVIDFIDLNFWPMHNWAVFNLADSSIVAGVILLSLLMLWEEWREQSGQRMAAHGR